jgi:hypothetical protein
LSNFRTVAAIPSPSGSSTFRVQVEESMRWLQVVSGAKTGLLVYFENPGGDAGTSRRDAYELPRDSSVCYIGGDVTEVWVTFPATSDSGDPNLVLIGSRDQQPPPVWPGPATVGIDGTVTIDGTVVATVSGTVAVSNFPASFAVTNFPTTYPVTDNGGSLTVDDGGNKLTIDLDYDDFKAEREDIVTGMSKGVGNGTNTALFASAETALTFPHKWRSVVVQIGPASVHADLGMQLYLRHTSQAHDVFLCEYRANSRGGGFPVVAFAPPNVDWNLHVANVSGANATIEGEVYYSTSPPTI